MLLSSVVIVFTKLKLDAAETVFQCCETIYSHIHALKLIKQT
jgi:hypothetical protein